MVRRADEPTATAPATRQAAPVRPRGARRTVTQLRDAAAKPTLQRLDQDRERVSERLKPVLAAFKELLFDHRLQLSTLWPRHGIRDKNVSSWFREEVGQTPWAYVLERRLEVGERLLRDTTLLLHQIAGTLGYSGVNTFTNAFKRRYGLSPTAYRKNPPALDVPEEVPGKPFFAVRRDVDAERAEELVAFAKKLGLLWPSLDRVFRTHPDFAAAHWYTQWIQDRLGHADVRTAWPVWRRANVDLRELLEWPADRRAGIVRQRPVYQTGAFVWLLVDCVFVRLLEDAGEAEHFADLAVAASEKGPPGLRALPLALKAHSVQRRGALGDAEGVFKAALEASRAPGVDPWAVGRVHQLWAELMLRRGDGKAARREFFIASVQFKRVGEELDRLRCAVARSRAWFVEGVDPSRLLTVCIAALEQHPTMGDTLSTAHLNRILSTIYLADRLTGRRLATIRHFREIMPTPSPGFIAAQYQRVSGLVLALEQKYELALNDLRASANWFEEHDLSIDAAVAWLLLSWVTLETDADAAVAPALAAYRLMAATGFNSHALQAVALRIYRDAQHSTLEKSVLRRGILLTVCPKLKSPRDRSATARG